MVLLCSMPSCFRQLVKGAAQNSVSSVSSTSGVPCWGRNLLAQASQTTLFCWGVDKIPPNLSSGQLCLTCNGCCYGRVWGNDKVKCNKLHGVTCNWHVTHCHTRVVSSMCLARCTSFKFVNHLGFYTGLDISFPNTVKVFLLMPYVLPICVHG